MSAEEAAALGLRIADNHDQALMAPYGPAHWTVLTTHVFWDAWLHIRDITTARGWEDISTTVEDKVAALYALLIASVPAARLGVAFSASVDLVGSVGRHYVGSVAPGRASIRASAAAAGDEQVHGELGPVVDALAGRGPAVSAVLQGDPATLEPLSWLRPVLAPQQE